jgi:hypothetical protein
MRAPSSGIERGENIPGFCCVALLNFRGRSKRALRWPLLAASRLCAVRGMTKLETFNDLLRFVRARSRSLRAHCLVSIDDPESSIEAILNMSGTYLCEVAQYNSLSTFLGSFRIKHKSRNLSKLIQNTKENHEVHMLSSLDELRTGDGDHRLVRIYSYLLVSQNRRLLAIRGVTFCMGILDAIFCHFSPSPAKSEIVA